MSKMASKRAAKRAAPAEVVPIRVNVNLSGILPTEFNVVVRPDPVSETIRTKSGIEIFKPVDTQEKEKYAAQGGTLIAVSPLAFTYERWPDGAQPPQVGDKVIFAKYVGMRWTGRDGVEYIIMKDKDIVAAFNA